jgi:RNA polymerase sigma factor, sigma-70 family
MGEDYESYDHSTNEVPLSNEDDEEFVDILLLTDEPESAQVDRIRPELVDKVFKALSADAIRGAGELRRSDIDRAYLRKDLSIAECMEVEERILVAGHRIVEVDEGIEEDDSAASQRNRKYLSEAEEKELGRKIQLALRLPDDKSTLDSAYVHRVQSEAERARALFVVTNVKYVNKVAKRIGKHRHFTEEDIAQEGFIGLLKAVDMYDPERGFRFKTYATWWIEQRMRRAIADGDRLIRLPVHVYEKFIRIWRARAKWTLSHGRSPSQDELAHAVGMEPEKLAKLIWRVEATECLEGDEIIGDDLTRMLNVPDSAPAAFDIVLYQELKERCHEVLETLTPREAYIIRGRFGIDLDQEYTLERLGEKYSLTRERIRQIEAKALKKLRHPVRREKLDGFLDS